MTVWLTSDLHLGHRLVANLRGFDIDTAAHDQAVCDGWASMVKSSDQVWVLGDVSVNNPRRGALELIGKLPGTKHLIPGNHDPIHPMHRDSHKWFPDFLAVFASVQAYARRRLNGRDVLLSHMPYTTDWGFEARYPQWRLPDLGEFLVHGHTHSKERRTSNHELHVGVDAWDLKPVQLDAVIEYVEET